MRWPLRFQILFPFAGVMLAVVVGVSLLDAYLSVRRTERQIERQLQGVAQTLLDATFPLTDAVLKQTRGLSGAEFVLTDSQGMLRASTISQLDASVIPSTTGEGQLRLGQPVTLEDQHYEHAAVAVRSPKNPSAPAVLHILYPRHVLAEARWQAAYPPLVFGSVFLVVVIALAMAIAARLTRPILELRLQLSRLVHGDFRPVELPARNDEMADLVRSVNVLGGELDELRRVIKRTERLSLLGQLSGSLAHHLRNSVTGARMAVQLHQRQCGQIDQDSLAVALRQLSITESYLQRFLTAGQPSAPRRSACDLAQVVADVQALVMPTCAHRNVQFDCDLQSQSIELLADAGQLRQMLLNLVLNAVEAAGPRGWVRIDLGCDAMQVTLRVCDSGPGPEPELVDRLFETFTTGKPEGVGLGLAVARQVAEAHGGSVRYNGSGPTCFEVVLPLAPSEHGPAEATEVASNCEPLLKR